MQSGVDRRITRFVEKPAEEAVLHEMKMDRELLGAIDSNEDEELFRRRWESTSSIGRC